MTREEAKKHIDYIPHFDGDKYVDDIYDDFENRTCENCRWSTIASATDSYQCKFGTDDNSMSSYQQVVNKDFGCNKWEKDKNND